MSITSGTLDSLIKGRVISAIKDNLVILQVVVPLLSAVACSLFHRSVNFVQGFACAVVSSTFIISLVLFYQVYSAGSILYKVGGWELPYGIELRVDLLSATMLMLVTFIGVVSTIYGIYPSRREIPASKVSKFYSVFLLSFSGLLGILVSNDAFNVYVFLEVASISAYVLVAMGGHKGSLVSAFEYLVIGTVGATLYLLGVGLLYASSGTLNMGSLAVFLSEMPISKSTYVGMFFVIFGLVIKAALYPFHGWLIRAYTTSPSFVAVFLSGTATKVMIYLVIRVTHSVFGAQLVFATLPLGKIMLALAALATVAASIFAVMSKDIKDVLAYSSVANIGCIIFAVSLNTYSGLAAAVAYLVNHSIVKSALFMVSGGISYHFGQGKMDKCLSLGRVVPNIASAYVLLSLSLVGMPPTMGFVAKWQMLSSFANSNAWEGLVALVVGSVCSVVYTWKVIEYLYFNPGIVEGCANDLYIKTPRSMTLCIWVMACLGLAAGTYPLPLTSISERIAASLLILPQ
ncbi:proton-conducting transporter membrane subunit [Candidatus Anaplasma sp. TIGMIC]|uniref:proton-conducting transporter transmembrane domain-containing protein n=1 Tax=Candidatus Anaplasma sp. TIGMIC TaxID=3020713 RepID=UPI00232EED32|nr:proton-conducting transporter membrane subunit [Candidatus Anaplasma sp. TIGMIC]MDB1135341.1 proton-conducting transporter membrane subunit [Candidatus Anaplasma sp. TIGMIC]